MTETLNIFSNSGACEVLNLTNDTQIKTKILKTNNVLNEHEIYEKINQYKTTNYSTFLPYLKFMDGVKLTWDENEFPSMIRDHYIKHFAWSIPSANAIDEICAFIGKTDVDKGNKIIEIAAGKGLWSAIMKMRNLDVITTSLMTSHYDMRDEERVWSDIEIIDAVSAVKKYSNESSCLFLSWGPGVLYEALEHFKGNKLIVIGEDSDGCTDHLANGEFGFKKIKKVNILRFSSLRDKMRFYVRS